MTTDSFQLIQQPDTSKHLDSQALFDLCEIYYLLSTATEPSIQDARLFTQVHAIPRERFDALPGVLVRVRALQQQITPTGPLLFTSLCRSLPQDCQCGLCGKHLCQGERFRCTMCVLAVRLVLGYQTLSAWLLSEQCNGGSQEEAETGRDGTQSENSILPGLEPDDEATNAYVDEFR